MVFDMIDDSSFDEIELDILQEIKQTFNEPSSLIKSSFMDCGNSGFLHNDNCLENSSMPFFFHDQVASSNRRDISKSSYPKIKKINDSPALTYSKDTRVTETNKVEHDNNKLTSFQLIHSAQSECEQQLTSSDLGMKVKKKRGRPKRDVSAGWPKRPLSAYNIFFQRERKRLNTSVLTEEKDNPCPSRRCTLSFTDLAREIAANWKKLSNTDKIPFEEIARENRKLYRKEVDVMMQKKQKVQNLLHPNIVTSSCDPFVRVCMNVDHPPMKKRRGRPKRNPEEGWPKRPLSAYNIFFKNERQKLLKLNALKSMETDFDKMYINEASMKKSRGKKHGIISFVDLSRTIAIKWKEMTEEAKFPYKSQANQNMIIYRREMKDFLTHRRNSGVQVHV